MRIQAMLLPLSAAVMGLSMGILSRSASAQTTAAPSGDIIGHVIAGYQGWLCEPGDGSPVGKLPKGTGNYHANWETYPDMREFPDSERFENPRGPMTLPNGSPAPVFSSDRDFTVDIHTRWMKQYGVEVAAIQRFGEVAKPGPSRDQKNDVTTRMMHACERNGVKFYIEYDASGSGGGGWGPDFVDGVKKDWTDFAVNEKIAASSAYARQNGKPVVELWGMGLDGNNIVKDPAAWKTLVAWFKTQGVYVIAGTPTSWATGVRDALPGFIDVYATCNAINPWLVGRVSKPADAANWATNFLKPDIAWCAEHHINYIPCVYPGTSFYNSNHKTKNIIPRAGGDLMWQQFATLRSVGLSTCFISMFDEYNEATAIAKSAENASMLPANEWFLGLDADGFSMSSDFYLRLTSDGAKMLKGVTPLQWKLPTPYRDDLFATSFEADEPQPHLQPQFEEDLTQSTFKVGSKRPQTGHMALELDGNASRTYGAPATFKLQLFDLSSAPKTITQTAILYYSLFPENSAGRNIAIDLHFTDGTWLSDAKSRSETHEKIEVVDQNGRPVTASGHHGDKHGLIPLNAWSTISIDLSRLAGRSIDSIWVIYNHPGDGSDYTGMLDDLRISR